MFELRAMGGEGPWALLVDWFWLEPGPFWPK